jgi:hypothetical protein
MLSRVSSTQLKVIKVLGSNEKYLGARRRWLTLVNPSNSGGRDQEDSGSKPAQANNLQDPILKKPITKKGWWSDSRCRL